MNYGQGVKNYWKQYELELIKAQEEVDKKVVELAKKDTKAAAAYMTETGIATAEDAIGKANEIHSQLYTFIAKHGGRAIKNPFAPVVE